MTNVTPWGTGYRSGALVVDKETGAVGVTQGRAGRIYTVKSLEDGSLWTAHSTRLPLPRPRSAPSSGSAPGACTDDPVAAHIRPRRRGRRRSRPVPHLRGFEERPALGMGNCRS